MHIHIKCSKFDICYLNLFRFIQFVDFAPDLFGFFQVNSNFRQEILVSA